MNSKLDFIHLHDYEQVPDAASGLGKYFRFYNGARLHQAQDYQTSIIGSYVRDS